MRRFEREDHEDEEEDEPDEVEDAPFSPDPLSEDDAECFRDDCRPFLPPNSGDRKLSFCMVAAPPGPSTPTALKDAWDEDEDGGGRGGGWRRKRTRMEEEEDEDGGGWGGKSDGG